MLGINVMRMIPLDRRQIVLRRVLKGRVIVYAKII